MLSGLDSKFCSRPSYISSHPAFLPVFTDRCRSYSQTASVETRPRDETVGLSLCNLSVAESGFEPRSDLTLELGAAEPYAVPSHSSLTGGVTKYIKQVNF